ncbi:MAG: hypothetical protein QXI19_12210 [Candidatus Caldarchaeum sp.]
MESRFVGRVRSLGGLTSLAKGPSGDEALGRKRVGALDSHESKVSSPALEKARVACSRAPMGKGL